jgi:ubiquinone/menaquinone biosynthesis C-methylase UbiE
MIDKWYIENLVDPIDKSKLKYENEELVSEGGRRYKVLNGIPIMLIPNIQQSIEVANNVIELVKKNKLNESNNNENLINTLGISDEEKKLLKKLYERKSKIDPVVSVMIAATSGYAYKHLIGNEILTDYPIPEIRLKNGNDKLLLDIGCNWGRWCISAARKGYQAVGIEPQLGALVAAKRITEKMELDIKFVCGDARYLPFSDEKFDNVFSYSVIQHFSEEDAKNTIKEISRVLKNDGESLIQMANKLGIRSIQHQIRRKFSKPTGFDVRYYTPNNLKKMYEYPLKIIAVEAHCYFGLGWENSDYKYMPYKYKIILKISEKIRKLSEKIRILKFIADSLYIRTIKEGNKK